ncbi:MAG: DMT family transporter [Hyphomicrobiales bacterium]|nr:MAG: DMT family transporter [Hyphomicrobiales bacterium]
MSPTSIFADRRALFGFATLCCLLWGSAVPAVKFGYGLIGIAPGDTPSLLLFAGMRFCLAGLLLLGYALLSGRPIGMSLKRTGEVTLLGLGQTSVQYLTYYVGLAHTTAVKTSIMSSTLVFFSVLLAHFIYADDRLTTRRIAGCLLGFAGVVAVNFGAGVFDFHFSLEGEGLLLVSTFSASLFAIYGRRLSQNMDATVMTGWQLLFGGVALTALGLAGGGHFESFSLGAGLLVVYLAAVSAVAFALWSLLLKHNPVGSVAVYNFEIPIFGALLAALVLGESVLEWKNLAALILVSAGIWLVTRASSPRSGTGASASA